MFAVIRVEISCSMTCNALSGIAVLADFRTWNSCWVMAEENCLAPLVPPGSAMGRFIWRQPNLISR